jgi:hypothetical protein
MTSATTLVPGTSVGPYDIVEPLGAGGPAVARGMTPRELRRGLAEAKETRT